MSECKHLLYILIVFGVHCCFTPSPAVAAFNPIQLYGEYCDGENLKCHESEGLSCVEGRCSCLTGNVPSDDKERCLKVTLSLNDECEQDFQCIASLGIHTACYANICQCTPDAVPIDHTCVKKPSGNELSCEVDIQCSEVFGDDAVCTNYMCDCKSGFHLNMKKNMCFKNKGLSEECSSDEECFLPMDEKEQHVKCISNFCRCVQAYSPADGNNICIKNGTPSASYRTTPLLSTNFISLLIYFLVNLLI